MDKFILNILLNHLPYAIFWKNKDLIFEGCNKQFAKQFGLNNPSEVVGKTDYDLPFPPHSIDIYRADDLHVINSGIPKLHYEETQIQTDGKEIAVLVSKVPYYDESNQILGVLGIYLDITDRKLAENDLKRAKEMAETASRAKTEFLENMRHDIRTPLNGIVGFAEILKMEAISPKAREYADNLIASSHALSDLLNEILEAIRVNSGEIPLSKKKFNLKNNFSNIINLYNAKAHAKKIDLSLEYDEQLPTYVVGDKVRLHRIILELVGNALKFTDKGYVSIKVKLAKKEASRLIIKILVEDSGIGIPPEQQEDIYLQFTRVVPSNSGLYKGAGLGLSVVKKFIDEIEGEIYVQSELRKGTKFTCVIPIKEALLDEEEGIEPELNQALDAEYEIPRNLNAVSISQGESKGDKSRILVVEDNNIAQKVAFLLLSKLECEVDIAANGEKALDCWEQNHYDLIFMDIGLPDMNGYEVSQRIRKMEQARKPHLPIIALTAHVDKENTQRCLDHGIDAVLAKPLTSSKAHDVLNSFILKKKRETETNTTFSDSEDFQVDNYELFNLQEGIKNSGDEDALLSMLNLLVDQSLPDNKAKLELMHKKKDWDNIKSEAIKIKGGAVYCGTIRLQQACNSFYQCWLIGSKELLDKSYKQLLEVINDTLKAISDWLYHQDRI